MNATANIAIWRNGSIQPRGSTLASIQRFASRIDCDPTEERSLRAAPPARRRPSDPGSIAVLQALDPGPIAASQPLDPGSSAASQPLDPDSIAASQARSNTGGVVGAAGFLRPGAVARGRSNHASSSPRTRAQLQRGELAPTRPSEKRIATRTGPPFRSVSRV